MDKKLIPTEKDLARIRKLCLEFVRKTEPKYLMGDAESDKNCQVTEEDIKQAVFLIEGEDGNEIRLSNEMGSWFCDYYLLVEYGNYTKHKLMEYIRVKTKGKFEVETYCGGYLVAYKQR